MKKHVLISLSIMTFILLCFIALKSKNHLFHTTKSIPTPSIENVTPLSVNAVALLSIKPLEQNTVAIMINTQEKSVSAVQLAIAYDPQVLPTVTVTPGTFFKNPVILSNKIDTNKKMIFYVIAISPNQQPPSGQGVVATLSYTVNLGIANRISLEFLPLTKITQVGVQESILKKAVGIEIPI